jgi:Extensin-like protein C-terminus
VQAAACAQFATVLAPGANVYHYNHIHVDLMRHAGGRHLCEPAAVPGDVVAARARGRYAAQRDGEAIATGSVASQQRPRPLGYAGEAGDRRRLAVPGED